MDTKPIFNSYIAKQLVRAGHKIVDLQPDKKRKNSVIFYFELTDDLNVDLERLSKNN